MHIRSALVFLSKVIQQFPTRTSGGKLLLTCVEGIDKEDNEKEDLKIMAKSVGAILKKRSSTWIDDEPKEKPKRPLPVKRTDTEELKTTTVAPSTSGLKLCFTLTFIGKSDSNRSLPPREKSGSNPPSSSTVPVRPKSEAPSAPKSIQSDNRSKPEVPPNPPKPSQNDSRAKEDHHSTTQTARNNTQDSRIKDISPNEAPSPNPPTSNGNPDRSVQRPNKRGREEDRPQPANNVPPTQSNPDKGRPAKPAPLPPRNATQTR